MTLQGIGPLQCIQNDVSEQSFSFAWASEGDTYPYLFDSMTHQLPPEHVPHYCTQSSPEEVERVCVQLANLVGDSSVSATFWAQPYCSSLAAPRHSTISLRGRVPYEHSTEAKRRGYQLTMLGHHARDFTSMADLYHDELLHAKKVHDDGAISGVHRVPTVHLASSRAA